MDNNEILKNKAEILIKMVNAKQILAKVDSFCKDANAHSTIYKNATKFPKTEIFIPLRDVAIVSMESLMQTLIDTSTCLSEATNSMIDMVAELIGCTDFNENGE